MPHRPTLTGAAAVGLSLLLGSCDRGASATKPVKLRLGSGSMTLNIPRRLVAHPIAGGGVRLVPSDAGQRRRPFMVELVDGDSPVPLRQARGSGAARILYDVARADGGSGGAEVTLIAVRRCGAGSLRLRLEEQIEPREPPQVNAMLDMLATARCKLRG